MKIFPAQQEPIFSKNETFLPFSYLVQSSYMFFGVKNKNPEKLTKVTMYWRLAGKIHENSVLRKAD